MRVRRSIMAERKCSWCPRQEVTTVVVLHRPTHVQACLEAVSNVHVGAQSLTIVAQPRFIEAFTPFMKPAEVQPQFVILRSVR